MKNCNVENRKNPAVKSALIFLPALFLIFSLLGLSACQSGNDGRENAGKNDQPLARRIGVVKSLGGVKTTNMGTHVLQLDDGSTILLKSSQVNLDDSAYLGKTDEVRGFINYTTDGKQVMDVQNIDTVEGTISQEVSKPQWKTYSNEQLGISIKYLDSLKPDESIDKVSFEHQIQNSDATQQSDESQQSAEITAVVTQEENPVHRLYIERAARSAGETLISKLGLKSDSYGDLMAEEMVKSKIGAGNYDALKKTDNGITIYYIERADSFFTIAMDCGQDSQTVADQNMFYEMLGTLQLNGAEAGTQETDVVNNEPETSPKANPPETVDSGAANDKTGAVGNPASQELRSGNSSSATGTMSSSAGGTAISDGSQAEAPAQVKGYTTMTSNSLHFSMQYPKNWYYGAAAASGTGVVAHYDFGNKPVDEVPGLVSLDVVSGPMPTGEPTEINKIQIVKKVSGDTVEYYAKGSGSRVYRISGPSSSAVTLLQMASSILES